VRDAVICEPLRTAVGGFGGVFRDVPATALAVTVIRRLTPGRFSCRERPLAVERQALRASVPSGCRVEVVGRWGG
jgi:acetyl-CoA acetyltransferase